MDSVPAIFISYRRADSEFAVARLATDLENIFGHGSVFIDANRIEAGSDFKELLASAIDGCDALLVVIGPDWSKPSIRSRLKDHKDLVRFEISAALRRNILVIPVLLSGAVMPSEDELPDELKLLSTRHAYILEERHWKDHVVRLSNLLQNKLLVKVNITSKIRGLINLKFITPNLTIFIDDKISETMGLEDRITIKLPPGRHRIHARISSDSSIISSIWWSKSPFNQLSEFEFRAVPGKANFLILQYNTEDGFKFVETRDQRTE